MPFADIYRRQAMLLIRLLPVIAEEKCFALKGGTAINLFERRRAKAELSLSFPICTRLSSSCLPINEDPSRNQ